MHGLRIGLTFCCALAAGAAGAQPVDPGPIGLWSYETSFGSAVEGDITLERKDERYAGAVAGRAASAEAKGAKLDIGFGDSVGRFRGTLRKDGKAIEGFWLRPAATDDPRYPDGFSQAFATPLTLQRVKPDQWRGRVHALPDRFRLYLKLFKDEQGQLLGAFRDPDQNRNGGASRFRVVADGTALQFQKPNDHDGFDTSFSGTLSNAGETLRLHWADLGRDIELQRRTPAQATAFFPRLPGAASYVYAAPPQLEDGWRVVHARDVGLDETALAHAVQDIIDGDPAQRRPSLVHSLLVARDGKLVLEEYFFGYTRDTLHDLRSSGKTFSSILLGAAIRAHVDIAPESKVYEVMAARGPFDHVDPRKGAITLAQLMTHSAGLACNDNDDASPGNEGVMQTQRAQPDWWKYTLDLPMAHDPGARYAYCSANINLVGGALTSATQTWLPEYFERRVARPLDFGEYHWNLMPTGEGYLGGGAWMRPRDLLKIGQMVLDGGVWRGRRIVDAQWVQTSTAPRIAITPETTGYSAEEFGEYYGRGVDGYAWHLGELKVGERSFHTYAATGNGGQLLVVAPELKLVAVMTGGNYGQGGIWSQWPNRLLGPVLQASKLPASPP